ncbi:hypothetical protein HYG81_02025 [Natrinema zhouii]|uniref:DUF8119 domain-containing protein n=1 Tax=Natrinema zhouii TaxID=1710539 RepID=A0A7D6GKQ5_9EURY|nr:hypothetical protein [Natrinema zhouii]QLK26419.1 hypothetical protein HYG81_02025 [Natrinema zhouii]
MARTKLDPARADRDGAKSSRDDGPLLESRRHRLIAYCRHNGERICRDTAVLVTWALVMTVWIRGFGLPGWLCYVVTFVGVVGYTQATTSWTRPYVSPDDFGR